jgi:hypothetical protein
MQPLWRGFLQQKSVFRLPLPKQSLSFFYRYFDNIELFIVPFRAPGKLYFLIKFDLILKFGLNAQTFK